MAVEVLKGIMNKSGYKTAALSSIYVDSGDGGIKNPTDNTMPGRFFV